MRGDAPRPPGRRRPPRSGAACRCRAPAGPRCRPRPLRRPARHRPASGPGPRASAPTHMAHGSWVVKMVTSGRRLASSLRAAACSVRSTAWAVGIALRRMRRGRERSWRRRGRRRRRRRLPLFCSPASLGDRLGHEELVVHRSSMAPRIGNACGVARSLAEDRHQSCSAIGPDRDDTTHASPLRSTRRRRRIPAPLAVSCWVASLPRRCWRRMPFTHNTARADVIATVEQRLPGWSIVRTQLIVGGRMERGRLVRRPAAGLPAGPGPRPLPGRRLAASGQ